MGCPTSRCRCEKWELESSLRDTLIFPMKSLSFALFLLATIPVFAEGTRTWEQSKYDDFVKGTPHGVAIASDGTLGLAPGFKVVASTPSSAVWATAIGPKGDIYAATGAPARIYHIVPGVEPNAIFQPQELQVQALVADKSGALFAATNPDGKVYRLDPIPSKAGITGEAAKTNGRDAHSATVQWQSSVFFDPGTKYIWALALDGAGNLYVATGDHGEIFRVTPDGKHSLFFKSDEPHIRALAFDAQGNLIAGSDGSGLIYRITPKGDGFVLYSAPKREITSLVLDESGNLYFAAAGEKRSGGGSALPLTLPAPAAPTTPGAPAPPQESTTVQVNNSGTGVAGGSEVYRIDSDGSPLRLWSSRDELAYSLAFAKNGHLLAGTGNHGQVFEISGRGEYTELVKAEANQITAFAKAADGLYAATSNLGKIFLLNNTPDADGSYESDIFDARVFSKWGRAEFRGKGNVDLFARSGNVDNPDRNWSPWRKIDLQKDSEITAPAARFIQWKAILHPGTPAPRVESVTLNYLPKNIAPEFDDVIVTPGTRYQSPPRPTNLDPGQRYDPTPNPIRDRAAVGVKWTVHDNNDDQMVYSLYYRGDGQSRWLLLKDNLQEKFYSFDSSLLPDGGYSVKVVASDAPSHSPGEALSSEKESDRFEVDTTPPQIQDLKASVRENFLHVQFRAADNFSVIKRAEYSIDAGDWHFVEPVGQLSDSKAESYDFSTALSGESVMQEHVVVVRAYDRYDNMNSAKAVVPERK